MPKEERVSIPRDLFDLLWRYHVEQELDGLELEDIEDRIIASLKSTGEMLNVRRCKK